MVSTLASLLPIEPAANVFELQRFPLDLRLVSQATEATQVRISESENDESEASDFGVGRTSTRLKLVPASREKLVALPLLAQLSLIIAPFNVGGLVPTTSKNRSSTLSCNDPESSKLSSVKANLRASSAKSICNRSAPALPSKSSPPLTPPSPSVLPRPLTNEMFGLPPELNALTVALLNAIVLWPVSLPGFVPPSAALTVARSNTTAERIVSGQLRAPRLARLATSSMPR